jgi:tetratricopeptide (TPR) repeat protein
MSHQIKKVMISSTARDLPEHREKVMHACMRLGMLHPDMMEFLTAADANAMEVSLNMVDEADLYIGVFAYRYGYVPTGQTISITEAEYNRAVERNIPRLIFLMSDEHSVKPSDIETGEGAEKLKQLKERLKTERVVGFFDSADDLLARVIQALVPHRESDLTTFHYISDIPQPPEAFIAHPYTLLQTHRLVGRQQELNLLTDWVAKPDAEIYNARILNIVAIGGLGKSALAWKWFNDIATQEMQPLAGRMWWSFYESDATFENFVTRALAYVTKRPLDEVQQTPAPERETQLLAALDREPFLLVLDGLERILIAYARMDAARLDDSQVGNQKNLRKTADPRAGRFLKKLAQVKHSRILVSTRLYPAELETEAEDPIPGCSECELKGLPDDDAVELWRASDVSGSRDLLLPVFATFDKHPLLIQALAGEVKRYRRAPGNFEEWRKNNPRFDPTKFPRLQEAMNHVLEFALLGLDDKARQALQIIAAFRMPARYDTLVALLIGDEKLFAHERELDEVLSELEDRGLVGWDKRANRYDLHPIVRGVVWSRLDDDTRRGVYTSLHTHFDALPNNVDWQRINNLEDLTPAIELYNTLIGLGRYDDALIVFHGRLQRPTLWRLNASRQRVELLEMLFPDGLEQLPRLISPYDQAYTFHMLAHGYQLSGYPERAARLFRRANISSLEAGQQWSSVLGSLSETLWQSGAISEAEIFARRSLVIAREKNIRGDESNALAILGLILTLRGHGHQRAIALNRSLRIAEKEDVFLHYNFQAMRTFWLSQFIDSYSWAAKALEYCERIRFERGIIWAMRLLGEAALGLNDFEEADERLHYALTRARIVNLVEEELPALVALTEWRRQQKDIKAAREFLEDVWEAAERGPYPIFHADALNVLAQVERDEGNLGKAVEAAEGAYRLAWCDGPPFAYHWGLEKAKKHLRELGAEEPLMPEFDASKFEPMPEVEIDPEDEFHAGKDEEV